MKAEVCLTPELITQHELKGKIVIVVDIFRATSCMVTGMTTDIEGIYPVETVEECEALGVQGMVKAGERGGQKVEGFDIGNSPFHYLNPKWKGKSIAVTTTNGTLTLKKSEAAERVLVGAFLNLSSTADLLARLEKDFVIHCAGWKGTPNLEDTLFAGALLTRLSDQTEMVNDSCHLAMGLYQANKNDLLAAARTSAHAKRLSGFGITKDIAFCMEMDKFDICVEYEAGKLSRI